ncbi:MFS transporter [Helicobacter jaachi]|uniref:MFS transporter n=1 Tax=Helicobacter jaachi TaxID=1677920 RepID=A0A4V6I2Y2_9HELI|nr:MFS transporter [Helicobacter jaachi]
MNARKKIFLINLLPVVLISLNLRAPITAVSPAINIIQDFYHLSAAQAGALISLPLLAFGSISFLVAYFHPARLMFVGLLCIIIGELVRSSGGSVALFIGTGIMGSGVAVANVLLPSFIKAKFPRDIPKIMGLYSLVLNLSSALGVALILPLLHIASVPLAMMSWAILAILAILSYLPQMANYRIWRAHTKRQVKGSLFCNKNAWVITLFMGCCSSLAYSFFTWYPSFIMDIKYSAAFASNMMLLSQATIIPCAFLVPFVFGAMRQKYKYVSIGGICALYVISFVILLCAQSVGLIILASILIGIPVGGLFGIALLFISSKSANAQVATQLSAMAQGVGYLLASSAPVIIGKIYDIYSHFTYALIALVCMSVVLSIIGFFALKAELIK